MRMRSVAGEPAGLLFAILARSTGHEATVYQQAPPAESFGWGVAFWDGQLRQLDTHDAETGWLVRDHAYTWTDQVISVDGRDPVRMPSFGNCMRCRRLLELLRSQATDADAMARCAGLVIAIDGVNSTLRRQQSALAELAAPVQAADHGKFAAVERLDFTQDPVVATGSPRCPAMPRGHVRRRCLDC